MKMLSKRARKFNSTIRIRTETDRERTTKEKGIEKKDYMKESLKRNQRRI